jgi:hypothetical protein
MAEHRPDVAREAPEWMYAYLAGVIDSAGSVSVAVTKSDQSPLGYAIQAKVHFQLRFTTVLGMIDELAEIHEWNARTEPSGGANNPRIVFARRDDIGELMTLVEPFLIGRAEQVRVLLDEILPGLVARKHYDKESFVELMESVDEFRRAGNPSQESKYDAAYFRDLWDLN